MTSSLTQFLQRTCEEPRAAVSAYLTGESRKEGTGKWGGRKKLDALSQGLNLLKYDYEFSTAVN